MVCLSGCQPLVGAGNKAKHHLSVHFLPFVIPWCYKVRMRSLINFFFLTRSNLLSYLQKKRCMTLSHNRMNLIIGKTCLSRCWCAVILFSESQKIDQFHIN